MPLDSDTVNADEKLHVEFYELDHTLPVSKGGDPSPFAIGTVFIKIMVPGDKSNVVDRPMRESDKRRFPRQYMAYTMGKQGDLSQIGTDLAIWQNDAPDDINRNQVDELRILKFSTVEQVALATDAQLQRIGMSGLGLRLKAKAWLDRRLAGKQSGAIGKLETDNAALRDQMAAMQAQMAELIAGRGAGKPKPAATTAATA